ncbi:MAG: ATP-binding protein [Eubacterium sp.]|nr:ATP-binding protein [Eubacterium sp.]
MSLTNSQYNSILRMYDEIRVKNRAIRDERLRSLYLKEPSLGKLDERISSQSVSCAKLMLAGDKTALDTLKKEIENCKKEKENILLSLGVNKDYLEMPYDCPDCRDTGFIGNQKCHCFKQKAIDILYQQTDLRRIIEEENFSTFDLSYYDNDETDTLTGISAYDNALHALSTCKDFTKNFEKTYENIFLCGNVGVGKTFLTHCIAAEILNQGHSVVYIGALKLFELFNNHIFSKDIDVSEEYDNIFTCDLLIIDDLGTEISSSATVSQLFSCLNDRIAGKRPTVISTNLSINRLEELYSERTTSRILSEYQVIKLLGSDIRLKKKFNQLIK